MELYIGVVVGVIVDVIVDVIVGVIVGVVVGVVVVAVTCPVVHNYFLLRRGRRTLICGLLGLKSHFWVWIYVWLEGYLILIHEKYFNF